MKAFSKMCFLRITCCCCLCLGGELFADTVTLLPSEDATISERFPDSTLGLNATIESGTDGPEGGGLRNRALLKFNVVAAIPGNAIVTSVDLNLRVTTVTSSTNLWFSLHKVLTNWSEASVSWTNRQSSPTPWGEPGGQAAIDLSTFVTQSNVVTGLGAFGFLSNPAMVADVQDWVSHPENNSGWMMICGLEVLERSKRKFASRESSTAAYRPSLVVQFTVPPSLALTVVPGSNGQFQFQFNAEPNLSYSVLFCEDVMTTNWLVLTNIGPLPTSSNVIVSDLLLTESNRFYRVRSP